MYRIYLIISLLWYLLSADTIFAFSRQDTLRGSNGRGRNWWNVVHYDLNLAIDTAGKSIRGYNTITAVLTATPADSLQIDLQELMFLDSVVMSGQQLPVFKEGNVWWVLYPFHTLFPGDTIRLTVYYHGKPRTAKLPPWDGGFIWAKDSTGKPWISVACQGLGASSWWPCKDFQGDKPDRGVSLNFFVPEGLQCIANGVPTGIYQESEWTQHPVYRQMARPGDRQFSFQVQAPINAYNVTCYIGDYIHWEDSLMGEKGLLTLRYHVLRYNEARARKHFSTVKRMLHCFEYWMGPYPFYQDGYKLVEAPFLGMEHQSAIAYGNAYKQGYNGTDRSGSGVGLLFDHLIVHESGHEWFGNNITAFDMADNWIHEGFTSYAEVLFAECITGREKAFNYSRGTRRNIRNDSPVIGSYGVNDDGSSDKYDKGAALVHMIRVILQDDMRFRQLLRSLNQDFYHQTVSSDSIEAYINRFTGYNFTPLFDQYLRTTSIPVLEWYVRKKQLHYRFREVADRFTLPVPIRGAGKKSTVLFPTTDWQQIPWKSGFRVYFPENLLIRTE